MDFPARVGVEEVVGGATRSGARLGICGASTLAMMVLVGAGCTDENPLPSLPTCGDDGCEQVEVFCRDPGTPGCTRLAVIADTQATSLAEALLLGREDNVEERGVLAAALAEEDVDLVAHVGDLVFDPSSAEEWAEFDELYDPVRARAPMLPVLGNHEYWGDNAEGLPPLFERFAHLEESRWYARTFGPLGLVVLDSNVDEHTPEAWAAQAAWLAGVLEDFDATEAVRGVLVLTHHPPFTNSDTTPDELHVQEALLPAVRGSAKALGMLSGHAHTYERFVDEELLFLVAGGGGGPRVGLLEGERARHADGVDLPAPRPFHYLLLEPGDDGVDIVVRALRKGETELFVLEELFLPWRE